MRLVPAVTVPADVPVAERTTPLALDEAEFRAFHEQTARSLTAYLRRSLPADAVEDAVQESYLRLLRTPHASLPVDERRAYLYRIASNLANDAWRARKKVAAVEGPAPADEEPAMTDALCPREADVLRACEAGTWPADLHAHVAACEACREVEAVTRVLRVALDAEDEAQLPTAQDIWWRAQWQARQDARAQAMRPLDRIERAEPLVALVAVVTLLVLRGDVLVTQLAGWATSNSTGQMLQAVMPSALLPVLLVGAGLGALVLLAGLGAVLAND